MVVEIALFLWKVGKIGNVVFKGGDAYLRDISF